MAKSAEKFDYLMQTARSMVAGKGDVDILDTELQQDALRLYSKGGGTFSSENAAINFIIYKKPSEVAKLIFKEADSIGKPIRHFIELLPAGAVNASPGSSQCGKGAEYNPADLTFGAGKTFCWLCGCPISGKNDKNSPECEHIIPALRATMTVGMFSRAKILEKIRQSMGATLGSEQWKEWNSATANNYLWAHSVCNQSSGKGAMVLLGYDEKKKEFNFDDKNGVILQQKIYNIINSGVIQPIPALCRSTEEKPIQSCYQRNDGKQRFYGTCTTANGDQWDPRQNGCVGVTMPYEAYAWEMNRAATQVNEKWKKFGGNIRAFAEYCLMQTKLYLSAEGLKLAMTEKERLANKIRQQQQQANEVAEYKEECAKVAALMATQIEIIKELHKLSAETLTITASDEEEPLSKYIFSGDLIRQKSRFKDQIQKIFTVYCRNSSSVVSETTNFVNHIMVKFFTDGVLLSGEVGGEIGPGGGWHAEVGGMMDVLVRAGNAERILTEYISCLVLCNIYKHYGWQNVAKMPHPTASTKELAAILYPYPGNQSASGIQTANQLREKFIRQHGVQDRVRPASSRPLRSADTGDFERLMNNIFQAAGTNFVLPAFDSDHACKLYLMQLFTILVGAVITNIPEKEWAQAFDLVITQQGQLLTQITADGDTIAPATQQQVQAMLSQSSKEQMVDLANKTVTGVLHRFITTNPILKTFLAQVPEFAGLFQDPAAAGFMVPVIGCNLMQRKLSVAPPGHPTANFLTVGRDLFCGQLGIDTAAIEATASMPSRSAAAAAAAGTHPHLVAAQSGSHIVDNPEWSASPQAALFRARAWQTRLTRFYEKYNPAKIESIPQTLQKYRGHEAELMARLARKYGVEPGTFGGGRRKNTRKRKRRKYRTIKKRRRRRKGKSLKRRRRVRRRRKRTRGK